MKQKHENILFYASTLLSGMAAIEEVCLMINEAKDLSDVVKYCVEEGVKKRTFMDERYYSSNYKSYVHLQKEDRVPIKTETSERIRKLLEEGPRCKKAEDGSIWRIKQYNDIGTGRNVGFNSYGFIVEKLKIE